MTRQNVDLTPFPSPLHFCPNSPKYVNVMCEFGELATYLIL